MLLRSLKRQQQNQWPRLYCLYLLLVKPALPEGASVIQRAKLGCLETAWQGSVLRQSLMVYPAPSLTGEILGSLKSYGFQRRFLSLAPFSTMPVASCLPFPAECLGSALSPTAFWRHIFSLHMGWGKQVQALCAKPLQQVRDRSGLSSYRTQDALLESANAISNLYSCFQFFLTLKHWEVKNDSEISMLWRHST